MSFFSNIETAIEAEIKKVEADLAPLWPKVKALVQATETEIANVAVPAVIAQISSIATGAQKFDAAVASVLTTLGGQGKSAVLNLVQGTVQLVYNVIVGNKPAS